LAGKTWQRIKAGKNDGEKARKIENIPAKKWREKWRGKKARKYWREKVKTFTRKNDAVKRREKNGGKTMQSTYK